MESDTTLVRSVATGAPAVFAEQDFSPLDARHFGVLGDRTPYATTSGIEDVCCAHSLVATG